MDISTCVVMIDGSCFPSLYTRIRTIEILTSTILPPVQSDIAVYRATVSCFVDQDPILGSLLFRAPLQPLLILRHLRFICWAQSTLLCARIQSFVGVTLQAVPRRSAQILNLAVIPVPQQLLSNDEAHPRVLRKQPHLTSPGALSFVSGFGS